MKICRHCGREVVLSCVLPTPPGPWTHVDTGRCFLWVWCDVISRKTKAEPLPDGVVAVTQEQPCQNP